MKLYPGLSANAVRILSAYPDAGGAHRWLAQVAGILRGLTDDPDKIACILRELCAGITHRPIPDREIAEAVTLVCGTAERPRKQINWPEPRPRVQAEALKYPPAYPNKSLGLKPADVLPALFRPGETVVTGPDTYSAVATSLEHILGPAERLQFICANPMGQGGTTQTGRESVRCLDNVAETRHAVIEFDTEADREKQARYHAALAQLAPLVLAVFSGGKSNHGWYNLTGLQPRERLHFWMAAAMLGADTALHNPAAWVRMPGGLRDNRKRQQVLFFKGI